MSWFQDCIRIGRDPASDVAVDLPGGQAKAVKSCKSFVKLHFASRPGVSWVHAELRLGASGILSRPKRKSLD